MNSYQSFLRFHFYYFQVLFYRFCLHFVFYKLFTYSYDLTLCLFFVATYNNGTSSIDDKKTSPFSGIKYLLVI